MEQKLIFLEGKNYGGLEDCDKVNKELTSGWMVQNVFPQKVGTTSNEGFGGFLVILKKVNL